MQWSLRAGLACLVLGAVSCGSVGDVVRQDELRVERPGARAVVVVFSRTGNTARAGLAMAEALGCDFQRLVDAETVVEPPMATEVEHEGLAVRPATLDLTGYDLVLLGAPIWYWEPAAPIRAFTESSDLAGKRVGLFFTYKGGVRDCEIEAWREQVRSRGGEVVTTIAIDRDEIPAGKTVSDYARELAAEGRRTW